MKHTKIISLLFIVTVASVQLFAQNNSAAAEYEKSLLWKIEGEGITEPSYLFGTVHLIPEADFLFTEAMQEAFDNCNQLFLEIDINIPIIKQLLLARKIYLPKRKTIGDYMNEDEFSMYKSILLDSLSINPTTVNLSMRIKPIFASGLFINELIEKPVQYEQFLNKRAAKNKIPMKGLETVDAQMNAVESISIEEQIIMLSDKNSLLNMKSDYETLIELYKSQNISELAKLIEDEDFSPEAEQRLLGDRNKNWIPIIEKEVKARPTFIAVGAGHLAGKDGLIQLLTRAGFVLSPVK